jgi:hypothetical protein
VAYKSKYEDTDKAIHAKVVELLLSNPELYWPSQKSVELTLSDEFVYLGMIPTITADISRHEISVCVGYNLLTQHGVRYGCIEVVEYCRRNDIKPYSDVLGQIFDLLKNASIVIQRSDITTAELEETVSEDRVVVGLKQKQG